MELFEEVFGEEGEQRVLGGADAVVAAGSVGMVFGGRVRGNEVVGHDGAEAGLLDGRHQLQPVAQHLPPFGRGRVVAERVDGLGARRLPRVAALLLGERRQRVVLAMPGRKDEVGLGADPVVAAHKVNVVGLDHALREGALVAALLQGRRTTDGAR